jgi:hypothetical protein
VAIVYPASVAFRARNIGMMLTQILQVLCADLSCSLFVR